MQLALNHVRWLVLILAVYELLGSATRELDTHIVVEPGLCRLGPDFSCGGPYQ
jgi:hypothetical protein